VLFRSGGRSITAGSLTLDWSGATNDVLTITLS